MTATSSDGSSQKDHLDRVKTSPFLKNKEAVQKIEVEEPELPPSCIQVWNYFMLLNASRTSSGFGVNPISHQEMLAFFTLEQTIPEPWEIDAIRMFDGVALKQIAENSKKKEKENKPKNSPAPRSRKR